LEEGSKTDIRYDGNVEWAAAMPEVERQQQAQARRTAAQRLLQALLPMATRLPRLKWHSAYENAFEAVAASVRKTGTRKRGMRK